MFSDMTTNEWSFVGVLFTGLPDDATWYVAGPPRRTFEKAWADARALRREFGDRDGYPAVMPSTLPSSDSTERWDSWSPEAYGLIDDLQSFVPWPSK